MRFDSWPGIERVSVLLFGLTALWTTFVVSTTSLPPRQDPAEVVRVAQAIHDPNPCVEKVPARQGVTDLA